MTPAPTDSSPPEIPPSFPSPGAPVNRAVLALHLFLRSASLRTASLRTTSLRTTSLRTALTDARARAGVDGRDRGDVPGWVLVTLMTAGLVVGLWALAGPRFEALFTQAMDTVVGQL